MTQELVMKALENAVRRRNPVEGLIHHWDRGSQVWQEVTWYIGERLLHPFGVTLLWLAWMVTSGLNCH
jgi:hypothetical protein